MSHENKEITPFAYRLDEGFSQWLMESGGTLAISTYQAGRIILVSWTGTEFAAFLRRFGKTMGLDYNAGRLLLASNHELTIFEESDRVPPQICQESNFDAMFLPHQTWGFPDIDVHDVALADSEVWMVVTKFSCLAFPSPDHTFIPKWKPRFITELLPEDRCHLNGLALENNKPAYVTALGETDSREGWRNNKVSGGIVIDITSDEIICKGLAMPHSPRVWKGDLWALNSGKGELIRIDRKTGNKEIICKVQGYTRGLTFVGNHALVGLCKIRETNAFGGMPVAEEYDNLLCGVALINMQTGKQEGFLEMTSGCNELYDLRFLPSIRRGNVIDKSGDEFKQIVTIPGDAFWLNIPTRK